MTITIDEAFMSEYLETVGYDLFEMEEGWQGKFEEPFGAWVKANHEWIFGEQPDDPSMMERLMKDEEEGGTIAQFINGLSEADKRIAVEGMMGLLVLDEQDDTELYTQLKAMLAG